MSKYRHCSTDQFPLVQADPGTEAGDGGANLMGLLEEYGSLLPEGTIGHLQARYGARWKEVARFAMGSRELAERIVPGEPDILAEAAFARREEMTMSLEDFFRRRTMLALKAPLSEHLDRIQAVAQILFGKDVDWHPSKEEVIGWQGLGFKNKK